MNGERLEEEGKNGGEHTANTTNTILTSEEKFKQGGSVMCDGT